MIAITFHLCKDRSKCFRTVASTTFNLKRKKRKISKAIYRISSMSISMSVRHIVQKQKLSTLSMNCVEICIFVSKIMCNGILMNLENWKNIL